MITKKTKHIAWCVTVGKGNIAYIMDNKVFDKKREAVAYRKSRGYPRLSWSDQWHIEKLQVIK
jgi:hypothetical protein